MCQYRTITFTLVCSSLVPLSIFDVFWRHKFIIWSPHPPPQTQNKKNTKAQKRKRTNDYQIVLECHLHLRALLIPWIAWDMRSFTVLHQYLKPDSHQRSSTTIKAIYFFPKNINTVTGLRKILIIIRNYCNSRWQESHTWRVLPFITTSFPREPIVAYTKMDPVVHESVLQYQHIFLISTGVIPLRV